MAGLINDESLMLSAPDAAAVCKDNGSAEGISVVYGVKYWGVPFHGRALA